MGRRGGSGGSWGLAMLLAAVAWVFRHTLLRLLDHLAQRLVRWRLGGYRVRVNHVDTLRPLRTGDGPKVCVVGGGLAGVAAAITLAERGLDVTLHEAAPQLGGKLASWTHTFDDGVSWPVEHGYHAFFPSYHNLDRLFARLGISQRFATTPDYLILGRDGRSMSFAGLHRTPGLNLLHLAQMGLFDPKELVWDNPGVDRLNDLLNYHPIDTHERLDHESYAEFADAAGLPDRMRLIFRSFTRVFFAEPEQMSTAELAKSFHSYFLSHDRGLLYRYPTDDHAEAIWAPLQARLEELGVHLRLGSPVDGVTRQKNGRLRVGGRPYDHVVLATDLPGARRVLDGSAELVDAEAPGLRDDVAAIQPRNRYAVLRIHLDRDLRPGLPGFVSTDRIRALDSITSIHRNERWAKAWVAEHGGSVLELHAYSVPAALQDEAAIRQALLDDMRHYLPELAEARVVREVMHVKDDFTPFFVGMWQRRPGVASGVAGLSLAGDWVKLREPVWLMEAAVTSGLRAANRVLADAGLREEPVYSVPEKGLLHGIR